MAMAGGGMAAASREGAGAIGAGDVCRRAPWDVLDALGATGATLAAREAHAFRATVGAPAAAGTRGTF
eukprot:3375713-Pleurochrysis_carterae.AAC.1